MVIKQVYLNHIGGRYVYRLHRNKIDLLCSNNGFCSLKSYLEDVFNNRPDELFNSGPRSSSLKFDLIDETTQIAGHEVSSLAKLGLQINSERFSDNHSKVQVFMLENDKNTVAMEVPIWLNPNELGCYETVFKSKKQLTGHIDVLRVENNNVWIWDYKPGAMREKYASTQIFFYALMLSKRAGIPLERFRCGYFDTDYSFIFRPTDEHLLRLNKQMQLTSSF